MERHFDQELADLKQALLRMAALAENAVAQSLKSLVQRDIPLSHQVDMDDQQLDKMEMEIDDRCIKLLALRQPIASDLRFITMAMKISNDLERIGDQAVTIAHRARDLSKEPPLKPLADLPQMAELSRGMIHDVLDAFVYAKLDLARDVIRRDTRVDEINQQLHRELTGVMVQDPQMITRALSLMTVSRKLERIADHATNIAEEVVYLYEARDIRHQHP